MSERREWVMLSYRIPREPSTPRIALWRKLRAWGVAQVADGLVVLPADARTREQFDWAAQDVVDAGGQATVWLARPVDRAGERAMVTQMTQAVARQYVEVLAAAAEAEHLPPPAAARQAQKLRRELDRIAQRDFFPPAQRQSAHEAVQRLLRESSRGGTAARTERADALDGGSA